MDCPRKRPFWIDALEHFQLSHLLPTKSAIWLALMQLWRAALSFLHLGHLFPTVWQALTTFLSRRSRPLSDDVLRRLGCIIAVLWQHHWRCKIEDQLWSTEVAYNTLQLDLLYLSFVPSNSPSV